MASKIIYTISLYCLLLSTLVAATPASSHELEHNDKTRQTPVLRDATYKKLAKIEALTEQQQWNEADEQLKKLLDRKLNQDERAQTLRMQAYVKQQLEQYTEALKIYELMLTLELSRSAKLEALFTLAQLYAAQENPSEALHYLEHWFAIQENPTAQAYAFRAQLYYTLEQYDDARSNIEKALSLISDDEVPDESWLQLAAFIYFQEKNYASMELILKQLIAHYSKSTYWTQLADIYNIQAKTDRQLQVLDAAYINQYSLSETHLIQLAHLLQESGDVFRAGLIVEQGLRQGEIKKNSRNYRFLTSLWLSAKEQDKAIEALQQAVTLSSDVLLTTQLAHLYFENEQYQAASDTARAALDKLEITPDPETGISWEAKQVVNLHLLIGSSWFYQQQFDKAIKAFESAAELADAHNEDRHLIDTWIAYSKETQLLMNEAKEF